MNNGISWGKCIRKKFTHFINYTIIIIIFFFLKAINHIVSPAKQ